MLDTQRLYLREQTIEDLDRMYEIYSGENITKYIEALYENRDDELEYTKAYIKNMYRFYGYGMWVVCLKENHQVIGRAGLGNREIDGVNMLELGYVIDEQFQRKGYAYEICRAICRFAQEKLYAKELICIMDKENVASVRLAKKLGFSYVCDMETQGYQLYTLILE